MSTQTRPDHGATPRSAAAQQDVVLEAGDYRARIATSGAMLSAVTLAGEDLVVPVASGVDPQDYQGKTLAPWPGRLDGASYSFGGVEHQLPVTEPETGAALHGLVCGHDFEVGQAERHAVVLHGRVAGSCGYPFELVLRVRYALSPRGLLVGIRVVNQGPDPAPYGVASHPYLRCGDAPLDDCLLHLPSARVWSTDDDRAGPVDGEVDFTRPRPVGATRLDHTFTDLPVPWRATLSDPADGLEVTLASRSRWLQAYTGDRMGRAGLALEPMSCPPGAFGSGTDLVELATGDSHLFTWSLAGAHRR